jgi:hypothetical protein
MTHLWSRFLLVALLAVLGLTAMAQDEFPDTFTTSGGLSIGVPEGYEAQELAPTGLGVLDPINQEAVVVLLGEALETFGMPAGIDAKAIIDSLKIQDGFPNDETPVSTALGDGFAISGEVPGIGPADLTVLDTEFGVAVIFVAAQDGEVSEEFKALAPSLIESVTFDPSLAVPTEVPVLPTVIPLDTREEDDGCPIAVADMPEGVLQFCLGAEVTYPEGWEISFGEDGVDSVGSLSADTFAVSLTLSVSEISTFYNPSNYKTESMQFLAEAFSYTSYDPETSWTTVLEEEGRKIEVYDPAAEEELTENDLVQRQYLITLNDDLILTGSTSFIPAFATEERVAEIDTIIQSVALNDRYTGSPSLVSLDGQPTFINALECGSNSFNFNYSDETDVYVVRCPAGCAADSGSVWGTDLYTSDSSVCVAAIHSGALTASEGGLLLVTMSEGLESYTGSTANGVDSRDYGTWNESFSVAPFEQ